MMMDAVRARVLYEGMVQGVGFRWRTVRTAQAHDVAGFVRNLPDGRVELVVEGAREVIAAFLEDVAQRMRREIRSAPRQDAPATGEFRGFDVRY